MQERQNTTSRVQSIVIVYIILGSKKMHKLVEFCDNLVISFRRIENRWEVGVLKKNAEKLVKAIVKFFDDEGISHSAKDGSSRFFIPFKNILRKKYLRKSLGLVETPIGLVFSECEENVKKSLEPKIPEEDKAFEKWDKQIDKLLAEFTEKRQLSTKKWLEMTVPVIKNSE